MLNIVAYRHEPVLNFFDEWAPELGRAVRLLDYATWFREPTASAGAWLFLDGDLLPPAAAELAAVLADQLIAGGVERRHILNHPAAVLGRFALLDRLQREGDNQFRVFALGDRPRGGYRYPVFVRARDHGIASELLHDAGAVGRAALRLIARGVAPRNVMIVELCDTADAAGLYRKYAYMRVGDRVFPAHLCFGRHWNVHWKAPENAAQLAEQDRFFAEEGRAAEVRRVFDRAGIEYGRIDYSERDGRMQVWEVNTNPTLAVPAADYPADQLALHTGVTLAIADALRLYAEVPDTQPIALRPERVLVARAHRDLRAMHARATWGRLAASLERRARPRVRAATALAQATLDRFRLRCDDRISGRKG